MIGSFVLKRIHSWDIFTPSTQQTVVASTAFCMETSSLRTVTFQMIFLGKKELVNLFLPELGHLVTEANICCALRQEVRLLLGGENTEACSHKCV